MTIKLVAWDVYGTLIETGHCETSDVEENENLRLREGALESLSLIKSKDITQCTCSDGNLTNLKRDLAEAGIKWKEFFDDLYEMTPLQQKDFSFIIESYKIRSENLLVIGDNKDIDIALAKKQGCQTIWAPEFVRYRKMPVRLPIDVNRIKYFL